MKTTKAWIIAVAVAAVIAAGSMVALAGHRSGQSGATASRPAAAAGMTAPQGVGTTDSGPNSPAATGNSGTTASPAQVQQALVDVLAGVTTPVDGQLKAVTPAEIEARVRAELAKIGLQL